MVFVLVHSPLVGPGTWAPVADELERRGVHALVPSLLSVADAPVPQWRHCADVVAGAVDDVAGPVVLAGHSGGGLLLPVIAAALDREVERLVFVDSFLPAVTGETPLAPAAFFGQLRSLAVGGRLAPWWRWWPEEELAQLVPDDEARAALARDMPSLPLSYFEQCVPSRAGWDSVPCAYLLLSGTYVDAAAQARQRGWRVEEIVGAQHLHMVVAPVAVTDALVRLTAG